MEYKAARTPRVLVLDDEPANLYVLQRLLRRLEPYGRADVVGFTVGTEALEWCAVNRPDLCLLDYRMPFMGGLEFLARARQLPTFTGVPVMLLTGSVELEVASMAFGQGVDDVIAKPFEPAALRQRIAQLLQKSGSSGAHPA
jgi:CheY-like chemotaxis protein